MVPQDGEPFRPVFLGAVPRLGSPFRPTTPGRGLRHSLLGTRDPPGITRCHRFPEPRHPRCPSDGPCSQVPPEKAHGQPPTRTVRFRWTCACVTRRRSRTPKRPGPTPSVPPRARVECSVPDHRVSGALSTRRAPETHESPVSRRVRSPAQGRASGSRRVSLHTRINVSYESFR